MSTVRISETASTDRTGSKRSSVVVEPVVILLGSNIAPRRNLLDAAARLESWLDVRSRSRIYASKAVGSEGPDFLNAALRIRTDLTPCSLQFEVLRTIEAQLGRRRGSDPNAPRTIDLDLVIYGTRPLDLVCGRGPSSRRLRLPDPDIGRHAHIALPLAEVAPDLLLPSSGGKTLAQIVASMSASDVKPIGRLPIE